MKTHAIILLIALLLPMAVFAGPEVDSYQYASIPWGQNLDESVNILVKKGYTESPTEIPQTGAEKTGHNPDRPACLLEKDVLNKYPATVTLFENEKGGLWKVRLDFYSKSDLRKMIIDGILVKKYGRPETKGAGSEIFTSSEFNGEWKNAADDSEIRAESRWTKKNDEKKHHLVIIYQKPDLVKRISQVLDF